MSKSQFNTNINSNLLKRFKTKFHRGERSQVIETYIEDLLNVKANDTKAINIRKVKAERDLIRGKISELQAELYKCDSVIRDYEEAQKIQRMKELEKEAEESQRAEVEDICLSCSGLFTQLTPRSSLDLPNKRGVCRTCYMASDEKAIKQWKKVALNR